MFCRHAAVKRRFVMYFSHFVTQRCSAQTLQIVIMNGEATKPRRNKNNN